MATAVRRTRTSATAALAALLLLLVGLGAAGPVLAKEGLQATLDAPVPRDAPGGTILLVSMKVVFPEGSVMHPVDGSPIYIKLVGANESTLAMGTQVATRGHYVMRIAVPAGGIRSLEVGIRGTTDLPIEVMGDPLVAGGISSETAQVAPAATTAPVPAGRATAPAPAPAGQAAVVAAEGPATVQELPGWVIGLAVVAAAFAIGLAALGGVRMARRSRDAGRSATSGG